MIAEASHKHLNLLILMKVLLFSMVFGLFTIDNRAILNISAVLIVLLSIYSIYKDRVGIYVSISHFLKNRKSLIFFLFWCLVCITFFTYKDASMNALGQLLKDWRYPLVILLFLIAFRNDSQEIKETFVISAVLTLIYIVCAVPVIRYLKNNPQELYLQLRYGFAFYIVMLFPFSLSGAIFFKKREVKFLLFSISFLAFVFLLYCGSRGGVLAILVETAIIIFLYAGNVKKSIMMLLVSIVIAGVGVTSAYNLFPQAKRKIEQSMKTKNITSGRDEMISKRYPLVMNSLENKVFGIGYGNSTYDQYLWDHNAPRNHPIFNKQTNKYNLDEPFFVTVLYNLGYVGLILFLTSMVVNLKDMVRSVFIKKDIFNISLITSFIGYFLVYCVFEKMFMEIYIIYTLLILFLSSRIDAKNAG